DRVVDQFQFRDTGIILTVTPHINSKDLVNLEIAQEVSEQGPSVNFGGGNVNTSFTKRQVKTTVLVQNGDTLILGGLIEEKLDYSDSGVPFLKDVPLIKYLFSSRRNVITKTELLITITPHVIANDYDAQAITEEFERRVAALRKRMEKGKWGKKNRRVLTPSVPPDSSTQPPAPTPPPASGSQLPSPVPPAATTTPSQLPPKPAGSN
ncbi:MAG: type II and III secretion system protein, partial [Candidatus Tectomicrobia bacterium]|nr:type II and III secretion system protein [Candidatus Tectomicrobia bacterium]